VNQGLDAASEDEKKGDDGEDPYHVEADEDVFFFE
jgi:hypothetical protein